MIPVYDSILCKWSGEPYIGGPPTDNHSGANYVQEKKKRILRLIHGVHRVKNNEL